MWQQCCTTHCLLTLIVLRFFWNLHYNDAAPPTASIHCFLCLLTLCFCMAAQLHFSGSPQQVHFLWEPSAGSFSLTANHRLIFWKPHDDAAPPLPAVHSGSQDNHSFSGICMSSHWLLVVFCMLACFLCRFIFQKLGDNNAAPPPLFLLTLTFFLPLQHILQPFVLILIVDCFFCVGTHFSRSCTMTLIFILHTGGLYFCCYSFCCFCCTFVVSSSLQLMQYSIFCNTGIVFAIVSPFPPTDLHKLISTTQVYKFFVVAFPSACHCGFCPSGLWLMWCSFLVPHGFSWLFIFCFARNFKVLILTFCSLLYVF